MPTSNVTNIDKNAEKSKAAKREARNAKQREKRAAKKAAKAAKIAPGAAVSLPEPTPNVENTSMPITMPDVRRVLYAYEHPIMNDITHRLRKNNIKRIRDDLLGKVGKAQTITLTSIASIETQFTDELRADLSGQTYFVIAYRLTEITTTPRSAGGYGIAVFRMKRGGEKVKYVTRVDFDDMKLVQPTWDKIIKELVFINQTYLMAPVLG